MITVRSVRRVQRLPGLLLSWAMTLLWVNEHECSGGMARGKRSGVLETEPCMSDGNFRMPDSFQMRLSIEFRDLAFSYGLHAGAKLSRGRRSRLARRRAGGRDGSGKSTLISRSRGCTILPPAWCSHRRVDVRSFRWRRCSAIDSCRAFLFSDTLLTTSRFGWRTGGRPGGRASARVVSWPRPRRASRQGRADVPKATTHGRGAASRCRPGRNPHRPGAARIVIDPAILILEDALSAVDNSTEEEILSRPSALDGRRRTSNPRFASPSPPARRLIIFLLAGGSPRSRHCRRLIPRMAATLRGAATRSSCWKSSSRRL